MEYVLLFLIAILLILLITILISRSETFLNENDKDDLIPLSERWERRWKELIELDIARYKKYFQPISITKPEYKFQKGKIFVSVASYRDLECKPTIQNLAEMADNPENLHIVVCQQNDILDEDCVSWCTFSQHKVCKQTVVERLSHKDARGPTYARWRIQQYWSGEEFFLQIDSHIRLVKHWDTLLISQLDICPTRKAVLTNYPCEYEISSGKNNPESEKWALNNRKSGLYIKKFDSKDGFTRINSDYTKDVSGTPWLSTHWAAGFSFSRGEFIKEVPYDLYTPFLFFGEELDITIRGYTHGWNFYGPTITLGFHNYKRDHRKTFWENPDQRGCEVLSRFRIYTRLGMVSKEDLPPDIQDLILIETEKYPIGNERSIKEYENFAKIILKEEKRL